jgi:hypothetical protein
MVQGMNYFVFMAENRMMSRGEDDEDAPTEDSGDGPSTFRYV